MFKNEGGGVKGRLNNVQKNRRFGPEGRPLPERIFLKAFYSVWDQTPSVHNWLDSPLFSQWKPQSAFLLTLSKNYVKFNFSVKSVIATLPVFLLPSYNVRLAAGKSQHCGGQTLWLEPYFGPYLSHNFNHIWAIFLVKLGPYFWTYLNHTFYHI